MHYRGRFAPSPSGALHFGSLVAAVGSFVRARAEGGAWLVRMEDIDPPREIPGAASDILATLGAFGMRADEPVVYQSLRDTAYDRAFARLRDADLVFPCWCSRVDLEASAGIHRGACRAAPDTTRGPAWRLRAPDVDVSFIDLLQGTQAQNLRRDVGDFVIRRVEGWFAYQLAVVVDDADAAITEVVRGSDLLDSTPRQIHLQQLLGLQTPAYLHLPVVLDADGRKLSKADHARPVDRCEPLAALRMAIDFLGLEVGAGVTPAALLERAIDSFSVARLRGANGAHVGTAECET
ncbi:MAG: tRNA glutamyl-Q(34) synthetase GluQRS [Rudaea sp.]